MRRIALIDADIVVYSTAAAAEQHFKWSDGVTSVFTDDVEEAIKRADLTIYELSEEVRADACILCFSDPQDNFRKHILPTYKATRGTKPVHYWAVRNHLEKCYNTFQRPGLEGDDIIGILATHPKLVPGKKIMVSGDKDLQTVPGVLYDPGRKLKVRISEEEADYNFLMQTLTGDSVDEYKGCPKIGPKKAAAILHAPNGERYGLWSMWQAVVAAYEARNLTEEDALVQARCARILRHTDYDYENKKPILWNPPA